MVLLVNTRWECCVCKIIFLIKKRKPYQEEFFNFRVHFNWVFTSAEPFVNVWILEHSFVTFWITDKKEGLL